MADTERVTALMTLVDQIAFATTTLALLILLAVVVWGVLSLLPALLSLAGR